MSKANIVESKKGVFVVVESPEDLPVYKAGYKKGLFTELERKPHSLYLFVSGDYRETMNERQYKAVLAAAKKAKANGKKSPPVKEAKKADNDKNESSEDSQNQEEVEDDISAVPDANETPSEESVMPDANEASDEPKVSDNTKKERRTQKPQKGKK